MKKFRILVVALFALLALSMIGSSAASAEICDKFPEAEWLYLDAACTSDSATKEGTFELIIFLLALWLEGGANVVETMLVTTTGELTLLNSNAPIVKTDVSVLCSGILHGFVGPNSADEVTELLSLGGTAIPLTALTEPGLECTSLTVCGAATALVWAVNLPWLTELELWETNEANLSGIRLSGFVDLILPHTGGGNVGWYIDCTVLGVLAFEECLTPEGVAEQINVATGVESVFSEEFTLLMGAKLALCSGNNEETGVVSSVGNAASITVNSLAGVLAASS